MAIFSFIFFVLLQCNPPPVTPWQFALNIHMNFMGYKPERSGILVEFFRSITQQMVYFCNFFRV